MIIFDELSFANRMIKKGFVKCFSVYELSVYAKYLKSINKTNEEIEAELISFSNKWNKDFVYEVDYPKIDKAIKSIDEYSLRIAESIHITENEWNKIMGLNNEKYRRILFIMLVISKYYKCNNTKIEKDENSNTSMDKYKDIYFCNFSDADILKLSGVKFRDKDEKNKMFNYFYKNDYMDITQGKKSIRIIKIINKEGEIKETIRDYDNIILYYERLIGEKIGECKECGKLFRQSKSNNGEYCYKHRGYHPQGHKTIKCVDCKKEFIVDARNMTKKRCDECQKINSKEKTRKRVQKFRINKNM
jgi:hypothetical protein